MVKTLSEKHGLRATFMPKPFENLTGNGCHAHISVWDGKKNKFLDKSDKLGLSKMAYNFLGGVIKNASSLSTFFNPTINSYRRINAPPTKSGASWSPSSISYTGNNRTHMIRIPDPGRFELRLMDGSANPYLLQASVLAAGLYGLKNKVDPGEPLDCNMYEDHAKYPDLPKLPDELTQSLNLLQKELDGGTITSLDEALPQADIVVWVASMPKTIEIDTNNLKKPCLMIDGGYPKNLDEKFQGENIHVLKGGIVEFFNDIGWNMMELAEMQNPQREMFACFAEAMILEFEKCHTNFSWGRNNISLEKMEFIGEASLKHGFSAIGLDTLPKALTV